VERNESESSNKVTKGFSIFTFWRSNEAVSISVIYAIFGVLWVLLSDQLLEQIIPDAEEYKHFQTFKGWFYILITTFMVYLLIQQRMHLLKKEIHKTVAAYAKLQVAHEELMRTEAELIYQKKLTESIITEAPVFIVTHDENRIISFNPYAQRICGYTPEDLKDKSWMEVMVAPEHRNRLLKILEEIKIKRQVSNYEFPLIAKDGSIINILWNSNSISMDADSDISYFVSFGTDITERKHYEEKIRHLAYYDRLTALPNRTMFESEINRLLTQKAVGSFLIAYIDIDNFKTINDSMGHQVGDLFLTYFADCLRAEIQEPNFAARLGGDEFAILFLNMSKDRLLEAIEGIRKRITKTWSIDNYQFFISMSIGVVSYPIDGTDSNLLLKHADIAMYEAKREGKNRVLFYQEKINDQNFRHMKMINNLQYGIDEEQFKLYYQPQFDLTTGEIKGMEALVRWPHPTEGFIPPGDFIPVAEESGQIYKLERWIITKALELKRKLEQQGYPELIMSINLSGKTLTSEINFMELEQIIEHTSVNYDNVVFEITETANISDVDIVINHLNRLKALGIRIALDDFGTGYSSLNYLKKFPINIIKLDKSFIDPIKENGIDTLLIKNILTLAHDLEFEVVAEGIETREQLEFLKEHSCGAGQGYLLGRPAPEESILELLEKQSTSRML
jgi:diguanylate cyclase (GGDEF)-like protein/PAS domain S-box-containing protein